MDIACDVCGRKFKISESLNQHKNAAHGQSVAVHTERKRKLAKGKIIGLLITVLIIGSFGYFSYVSITGRVVEPGLYDEFAQCLTEKGVTFYGTYLCPNCKEQKKLFGSSIEFVDYVECDPIRRGAQPELCEENNIVAVPTWIIDGKKYEGVQSLDKLSELTGCELPQ